MKTVSVVASCFNEEDNVDELYRRVVAVFDRVGRYQLELILIDNASEDRTAERLRALAQRDHRVKVILGARNFGHIRAPFHAMMQATGDAIIQMASDLQDPPELIEAFLDGWERGYKKVVAVKPSSHASTFFYYFRKLYYAVLNRISELPLVENFTGFGLFDRVIIDNIRSMNDPYPYFRGLVNEVGFDALPVEFVQPARQHGVSKVRIGALYDLAMLGITNYSKVPLRMATIGGFILATLNLLVALGYLIYKLLRWGEFAVGQAPLVIGTFFLFSMQLFFTGLLGEYILAIHRHVLHRPLVVERERINFERSPDEHRPHASATDCPRAD